MKTNTIRKLLSGIGLICACSAGAQTNVAGTFKHITIDGSFNDWTGVPLAYTAPEGSADAIQYENVYLANDQSNLYIQFTLYSPRADAFANSYDNIFIGSGDSSDPGYYVAGINSDMLIQWGSGYQEKDGGFNEGAINDLGWQIAGSPDSMDFELAISRNATYASDGTPVFTNNTVEILLEGDNTGYNNTAFAPPYGGFVYTFAPAPATLTTNLPLLTLTNSSWQVDASGEDLGTNWLAQNYDDTQTGWSAGDGLFGYTPHPSAYPPIRTPLSSSPNTYYFITQFDWTNDPANLAFVVTNYLSDGAVYYLNGEEVTRIRMPAGAVSYSTSATGTNSPTGVPDVFGIDGNDLFSGTNTLEVEVHQAPADKDMVFGLSLTAEPSYPVTLVDTNQPGDQTILTGQSVTFTSDILGSGPLTYQWYFDATNAIAGANSSTYTIPVVLTNNAGTYTLAVSNSFSGVITRSALLTVTNIPVTLSAEPVSVIAVEGQPATLSVTASGSPTIAYQWFDDSTAIANATNSSYTIVSLAMTNSGSYYVNVSNPAGMTNSTAATLTVLPDTLAPAITNISASYTQVTITFSKPVDPATAGTAAHYTINEGVSVSSAMLNTNNPAQVILTTTPMSFGALYTLTVNGVDDLYGNAAAITADFTRDITIDGSFNDWTGLTPVYSSGSPSGNAAPDGDGAADFANIYVYNDANYYYFYVTLWSDIDSGFGQFPDYVNMFFDTDNDPSTGYEPPLGSEMLIQSGFSYQEKDGTFNDGVSINGLNWLCLPASPGTNFEFQIAMSATFQDGTSVFTANAIQFLFQGMDPSFDVVNAAPAAGGTIAYTSQTPVSVPALPLGKLAMDRLPGAGGQVAIVWETSATLQSCTNLVNPSWTAVPSATNPYVVPRSGKSQFFRLAQ